MSCLSDKVAIVTGSSRGLGRAIAREARRPRRESRPELLHEQGSSRRAAGGAQGQGPGRDRSSRPVSHILTTATG